MASEHMAQASAYSSLPSFTPPIPDSAVGYVSVTLLGAAFLLSFIFTTLPKKAIPLAEVGVALLASALLGLGTVATFCWVGVSV
ncbi:MAG: hypothetical protein CYPHOPRED_003414 [Cyphobasidiales sp. Tagirdzhanova-0007]|nr:MAG: hypothetical protein CYPHOPRED_003414 [Cyphobasidiales sp. Tagirdzhanova-0007]